MSGIYDFWRKNLFKREIQVASFTETIALLWQKVYLEKGPNHPIPEDKELVSGSISDLVIVYTINESWVDLITRFLGLPFFSSPYYFKNFAGWDDKKFLLPINILRALFFIPLNLLLIAPRLALNLVKLITEFIPLLFTKLLQNGINGFQNMMLSWSMHWSIKVCIGLSFVILFPLSLAFKLLYVVGRAVTSPQQSLTAAWEAGAELAGDGILGKIISCLFALISLAITTLCYLILFPLAIKLLITYAPSAIAAGIQAIVNFLAPLSSFGTALETVTAPIFSLVGVAASLPAISGLAGIIGLTAGPSTLLADRFEDALTSFTHWWRGEDNADDTDNPIDKLITQAVYNSRVIEGDLLASTKMSNVYKGTCQQQVVVIKRATQVLNAKIRAEWRNEFNIHTQLKSPYVVSLFYACEDNLTLIVEYMAGGSLWDYLREPSFKDDNWQIRYQIGIDITLGVKYLHDQKIIHADLKSANILLDAEKKHAKLADFGLSSLEEEEKISGYSRGTSNWAAPEVLSLATNCTRESDVYSYACVLYELSAPGHHLFEKKIPVEIIIAARQGNEERAPIPQETPKYVKDVISQCWAQKPKDRLTISEALASLEEEFESDYRVK